ncbi:hypothetical protein JXA31_10405 [Candidatus Bathyarchaeota archaeon]|nr:hypothetical protein [Candidatus Bathyarchaeota archaeon]
MKRAALSLTLILSISVSLMAGIQTIEVAKANFFPGDALIISSPISKIVYANTSIPLNTVANIANPTPEIVSITYCLDDNPNVTLTNLNETLRVPGHIAGSQFSAELVLENLAEGNHTLKAYSKDAYGKQMSASVEFVIDTSYTSPLSVLSPQNITYTTTEVPLTFTCREDRKHDGDFSHAVYLLDGLGSKYIYDNLTLTDLSVGSHTIVVTVCTENGFFSETIYLSISQTLEPAPSPSSSPFPTPEHTLSVDPNFMFYSGLALLIIVVAVFAGFLFYFKKRKH